MTQNIVVHLICLSYWTNEHVPYKGINVHLHIDFLKEPTLIEQTLGKYSMLIRYLFILGRQNFEFFGCLGRNNKSAQK